MTAPQLEGATPELPILDETDGERGPTYDLPGRCLNCGARFIVRRPKGWRSPLSVECPACECTEYSWRDHSAIFDDAAAPSRPVEREEDRNG